MQLWLYPSSWVYIPSLDHLLQLYLVHGYIFLLHPSIHSTLALSQFMGYIFLPPSILLQLYPSSWGIYSFSLPFYSSFILVHGVYIPSPSIHPFYSSFILVHGYIFLPLTTCFLSLFLILFIWLPDIYLPPPSAP